MLLNTYNYHCTDTHFIFSMFVSVSWARSTYVICDLFFHFSLIFIVINHITTYKQRYFFFLYFLEYLQLFLGDNVDEEPEYFSK